MERTKKTYENAKYYAIDRLLTDKHTPKGDVDKTEPEKRYIRCGEEVNANPHERTLICPECHISELELINTDYHNDEHCINRSVSVGFRCKNGHEFHIMIASHLWESRPSTYSMEVVEGKSLVDHIDRKYGILTPMGLIQLIEESGGKYNQFTYINAVKSIFKWDMTKEKEYLDHIDQVWSETVEILKKMDVFDPTSTDQIKILCENEKNAIESKK